MIHVNKSGYSIGCFIWFYFLSFRRIHISRTTLDCLGGIYKTEDGHGGDRNEFLMKHNIDTFLICPSEERNGFIEPIKVQRTIRTWNPEIPFGHVIDMNSVSPSWIVGDTTVSWEP